MKKKTMMLLWMGAAISLSEIFTGGLVAHLGFAKGLLTILVGHIIGCCLFAFGGYISFSRNENAMDSVVFSLGRGGGRFVALCNVVQLLGWTIVMIVQAGSAITGILPGVPYMPAALSLSVCVLVWAFIFGSPAGWINNIVVALLVVLCAALFAEAVQGDTVFAPGGGGSMALAIELSIAMPVSWLPLVGDYSRKAGTPLCAAGMPFIGYFAGSVLMYVFGMYISIAGGGDIFTFIASSRFRIPACGVVLFSTLTTAFLDLYSAAVSFTQFVKTKTERLPILVIGLAAAVISVIFPAERYGAFLEEFLMSIGMVFVPVYTVVFLDFLAKRPRAEKAFPPVRIFTALAGMAAYRFFTQYEIWIPTVLSVVCVSALYFIFARFEKHEVNK
ncbi:MAG: permease [Spirochaetales bacterium]|jgi:putative hydroxymethylpyrimidine transporter CytX|nr:permease [Spirochaetales bacterium]